jgi:hypothetical protein
VASVELGVITEGRIRSEVEANLAGIKGTHELEVERRTPDGAIIFGETELIEAMRLTSAQTAPDEITIDFLFRNDGELTIRAPALEFREARNKHLFDERLVQITKSSISRFSMEDAVVYPGDEQAINQARLSLNCKRETVLIGGDYTLSWKVFLDNSSPSFGDIDLATLIETARKVTER